MLNDLVRALGIHYVLNALSVKTEGSCVQECELLFYKCTTLYDNHIV
jgi:hypothetical protein